MQGKICYPPSSSNSLCCPEQLNHDLNFQKVSIPSSIPDPSTLRDPKVRAELLYVQAGDETSSFGHYCPSPAEKSTYFTSEGGRGPREGAGASGSGGAGAPLKAARPKGARGRAGALTAPGNSPLEVLVVGKGKSEKSLNFFFFFKYIHKHLSGL